MSKCENINGRCKREGWCYCDDERTVNTLVRLFIVQERFRDGEWRDDPDQPDDYKHGFEQAKWWMENDNKTCDGHATTYEHRIIERTETLVWPSKEINTRGDEMKITENQLTVHNLICQRPIPEALYSCGCKGCAEQCSYPPDMLWWSNRRGKWLCKSCWWDYQQCEDDPEEKGISLADELKKRGHVRKLSDVMPTEYTYVLFYHCGSWKTGRYWERDGEVYWNVGNDSWTFPGPWDKIVTLPEYWTELPQLPEVTK